MSVQAEWGGQSEPPPPAHNDTQGRRGTQDPGQMGGRGLDPFGQHVTQDGVPIALTPVPFLCPRCSSEFGELGLCTPGQWGPRTSRCLGYSQVGPGRCSNPDRECSPGQEVPTGVPLMSLRQRQQCRDTGRASEMAHVVSALLHHVCGPGPHERSFSAVISVSKEWSRGLNPGPRV